MLKIYNSLTRAKETFTPILPGKVGMYVCGMTVYDYCHLGHARVMVVFDVVKRCLVASGFDTTYVRTSPTSTTGSSSVPPRTTNPSRS